MKATTLVNEYAERRIITAIMQDEKALQLCAEARLSQKEFGVKLYRRVYKMIVQLNNEEHKINIANVIDGLVMEGGLTSNDQTMLETISSRKYDMEHLQDDIDLVREKGTARALVAISQRIEKRITEGVDPYELLPMVESKLTEISFRGIKKHDTVEDIGLRIFDKLARGITNAIPTGFNKLDELLAGGFRPGELVIVAAAAKVGKSAFCCQILKIIAEKQSVSVGIISMEMNKEEIVNRWLSAESGIPLKQIRNMKVDVNDKELGKAFTKLSELNIIIDDERYLSLEMLVTKLKHMASQGIKIIAVDYLQLMDGPVEYKKQSRTLELGAITRAMKIYAGVLNITIILVSQLSRGKDKYGNPLRPQLSRLRDSGAIEQDGEVIIFLHPRSKGEPGKIGGSGNMECIVEQRNGDAGMFWLEYTGHLTRYKEV